MATNISRLDPRLVDPMLDKARDIIREARGVPVSEDKVLLGAGSFAEVFQIDGRFDIESARKNSSKGSSETINFAVRIEVVHNNRQLKNVENELAVVETLKNFWFRTAEPDKELKIARGFLARVHRAFFATFDGVKVRASMFTLYEQSLESLIENADQDLPAGTICNVGYGILRGVRYLRKAGVAHRDLKPANIMLKLNVKNKYEPRIVDFGLAIVTTDGTRQPQHRIVGTMEYFSPELIRCALGLATDYSLFAADLWAANISILEMITRHDAFHGLRITPSLRSKLAALPNDKARRFLKRQCFLAYLLKQQGQLLNDGEGIAIAEDRFEWLRQKRKPGLFNFALKSANTIVAVVNEGLAFEANDRIEPDKAIQMLFEERRGSCKVKWRKFAKKIGLLRPTESYVDFHEMLLNDGALATMNPTGNRDIFCCQATSDFKAENVGELSLAIGDYIQSCTYKDRKWIQGYIDTHRFGMFPAASVQILPRNAEDAKLDRFLQPYRA